MPQKPDQTIIDTVMQDPAELAAAVAAARAAAPVDLDKTEDLRPLSVREAVKDCGREAR